ncbi:MAG TPA: tetratricopeptide repeat protein, partial [Dehalococcoidia bacterium]|nr:tetratricopeptide repeat protein [Dehalococcoidia bacterium]
ETLRARSSLANCYYAAGRYEEAISQFAQVLQDRERVLGPDHPDTLRSRGSLANSYRAAGLPQEALGRHRGLLPDRERVLGPDHLSTQATRKNLASTEAELAGGPGKAIGGEA